jgi:hypothetical protein
MLRRVRSHPLPALVVLIASTLLSPGTARAQLQLELLIDAVQQPMHVTHAGDARLFIVERAGRVRVYENGALRPTPYLDVSGQVSTVGEGGLASIAFDPKPIDSSFRRTTRADRSRALREAPGLRRDPGSALGSGVAGASGDVVGAQR